MGRKLKVGDVFTLPDRRVCEVIHSCKGYAEVRPVGGGKAWTISQESEVDLLTNRELEEAMSKSKKNSAKPKAFGKYAPTRLSRTLAEAGWTYKLIVATLAELRIDHITAASVRACMSDKRLEPYEMTADELKKLATLRAKLDKALEIEAQPKEPKRKPTAKKAAAKKAAAKRPITKADQLGKTASGRKGRKPRAKAQATA